MMRRFLSLALVLNLVWAMLPARAVLAQTEETLDQRPALGALATGDLMWAKRGTGPGSDYKINVQDMLAYFVGTGQIPNDITSLGADGTDGLDDSVAFEAAVAAGGAWYVPPGTYYLNSTTDHPWGTDTVFWGLDGARDFTTIDIGTGDNFDLTGGSVGLYNLAFQNGDDFISANDLATTVPSVEVVNTRWTNTQTAGVSCTNNNGENPNGKIERYVFHRSIVSQGTGQRGVFCWSIETFGVWVTHNKITGGENAIQIGYVENTDAYPAEVNQRKWFFLNYNNIGNIDGNGQGGNVMTGGIFTIGNYIQVIGNHLFNCADNTVGTPHPEDNEAIYLKAQHYIVAHNTIENCGDFEGAIIAKGKTAGTYPDCPEGACGRDGLIHDNIIRNTRVTANTYTCIYVQSDSVNIHNNKCFGATAACVDVNAAGRYYYVRIANNDCVDLRGQYGIKLQGNNDNFTLDGNKFYEHNGALVTNLYLIDVDINTNTTMDGLVIRDHEFPDTDQGDNMVCIRIRNSGTLRNARIWNNDFGDCDDGIMFIETGTVQGLSIAGNDFSRVADPYDQGGNQSFGTGANDCWQFANRNWNGNEGACAANGVVN